MLNELLVTLKANNKARVGFLHSIIYGTSRFKNGKLFVENGTEVHEINSVYKTVDEAIAKYEEIPNEIPKERYNALANLHIAIGCETECEEALDGDDIWISEDDDFYIVIKVDENEDDDEVIEYEALNYFGGNFKGFVCCGEGTLDGTTWRCYYTTDERYDEKIYIIV